MTKQEAKREAKRRWGTKGGGEHEVIPHRDHGVELGPMEDQRQEAVFPWAEQIWRMGWVEHHPRPVWADDRVGLSGRNVWSNR